MTEEIIERISTLLVNNPEKIKTNRELFTEFIELHTLTGGKKQDCYGCTFSTTFNRMKNVIGSKRPKNTQNVMSENTFKLKNVKFTAYIRFKAEVINKDSSDELALFWINQFNGKYKEEREAKFEILPSETKKLEQEAQAKASSTQESIDPTKELAPKPKRKRISKN